MEYGVVEVMIAVIEVVVAIVAMIIIVTVRSSSNAGTRYQNMNLPTDV